VEQPSDPFGRGAGHPSSHNDALFGLQSRPASPFAFDDVDLNRDVSGRVAARAGDLTVPCGVWKVAARMRGDRCLRNRDYPYFVHRQASSRSKHVVHRGQIRARGFGQGDGDGAVAEGRAG